MTHLKIHPLLYSLFFSLLLASQAQAYPDFIGYGYSTCITCHYNGQGGGPLNDYGRALFATEITARDVYSKETEEDEIGAQSGFLGSTQLPWWIRPGLKYRGLWLKTSPGSQAAIERYINMQNEANVALFFDKKQTLAFIATESYTGLESYYGKTNTWFTKEYYLRWKQSNNFWLYVGQMDKVFGIRNVDHTAVNRSPITLGQFDQSQGLIAHFTYPDWDIAANVFFGNENQKSSDKQKGFSIAGEKEVLEKFKVGGSFLSSESETTRWKLLAFTTRLGLSKGSSLMAEVGLKEKTDLSTNSDAQLGNYVLVETLVNLRRGYNLLSVIEESKPDVKKSSAENLKWSIGALLFPLPRLELRMMAVNGKTNAESTGTQDTWALQGQVHVSY
ncbi:MAG: hypothetical protein ACXVCL_18290 [Bdellovibrio sp.]